MLNPDTSTAPRRRCLVAALALTALVAGGVALSGAGGAHASIPRAERGTAVLDHAADHRHGRRGAIQRSIEELVSDPDVPGVELSVRDADGRVRDYTAGVGNLETGARVPRNGQVRIASNTKTFTATVVLQLVGEGKISLDEPIETYLPALVRGEGLDGRNITVRQVLQQNSGLPDYVEAFYGSTANYVDERGSYVEPRQLLDAALAAPAKFAPGAKWEYSNTNYLVAGLIVQRVTERPIGEEITRRIIDRAGLDDTYWPGQGFRTIDGKHPQGYFFAEPGAEAMNVTEQDPSAAWAAGQLISTPRDLGTFNWALLDGELLEPAQQKELETTVDSPDFDVDPGWSYGLGFARRTLECGVVAWGHGGDIPGYETRNLTTADGRSAVIAVTALPTGLEGLEAVNAVVEDAICG